MRGAKIITINSKGSWAPAAEGWASFLLLCGHLCHCQCVELVVTKMFCPLVSITCLKTILLKGRENRALG